MTPFVPISFAKSFVKRTPESRVRLVVVVDRKLVVASDQLSIWIDMIASVRAPNEFVCSLDYQVILMLLGSGIGIGVRTRSRVRLLGRILRLLLSLLMVWICIGLESGHFAVVIQSKPLKFPQGARRLERRIQRFEDHADDFRREFSRCRSS